MATLTRVPLVRSRPRRLTSRLERRLHFAKPEKPESVDPVAVPKLRSIDGTIVLPLHEYHTQQVPGIAGAERASGYINVSELPDLTEFTQVNPRTPKLTSPVVKQIMETLTQHPLQMALKNRGIFLIVGKFTKGERLMVELKDKSRHGIIDGGHTYLAIRQVLDHGTDDDKYHATKASIPIHVFTGVPHDLAVEMAAGLNTSKQVQTISLDNLRGYYDSIRKAVKGTPAENEIAYEEGEKKSWKIGEILGYVEMFNFSRYSLSDNPYDLYAHVGNVAKRAGEDLASKNPGLMLAIDHLPDILKLVDMIHKEIQPLRHAAEPTRRGRGRPGKNSDKPEERTARILLPFIGEKVHERLGAGWLYPILAAFRANVMANPDEKTWRWKRANEKVLHAAAKELVAICQAEQRAAAGKPEWVGKRESAYRQCKMQIDLTIQKLGEK